MPDIFSPKDKWAMERWGLFTASEAHKLLPTERQKELFGTGALTYIQKKAVEQVSDMWENPKIEFALPIRWGRQYEQPAFDHYVKYTGRTDMRYFGTEEPLFFHYNKDVGCSPDGAMGEGLTIHRGLELKCPEQTTTHFRYCLFKDQYDLKKNVIAYYTQIQLCMHILKAPVWDFVSYDERIKYPSKRMKLIEVYPDKSFMDDLLIILMQATRERDKMVQEFLNAA